MAIRRSSKILVAAGLLLIVAAAVLRFVIVPSVAKLPDNLDVTNRFEGTGTLLNPAALQAGDIANVIATGVPVSIDRHTYVSSTDGDTAITHDDLTVNAPDGVSLPTNHTYAVDRTTMESAPAPAGIEVEPHTGITIGLPIDPDPETSYGLYDFATRTTVPMNYIGSDTISGRDVLRYTIDATGPLADPAVLGALPPALPKAQLAQLAPALPAEVLAELTPEILAALPDPVPFTYTAITKFELVLDKKLGTPIDGSIDQQVIANVAANGQTISLVPALALATTLTADSIAAAADTAASTSRLLTIASLIVPIALVVLGIGLIALGFVRRRPKTATQTSAPGEELVTTP
ncbi:porin PorA family protein [Rhodococcus opacus]|uniref:Porin PorA family protein n=1 Tax=Rhodococcus opacus TaxID=37919 RepID=A0AAX3YSE4_RHOOP|nr:porin PorA family protein [Rhodococcus opacus]MCZ4587598.1 porin PorA family protein [Rhodococcus opacus]WLF51404.1 porin PorA family protein [Rhodococcus opacus]